MQAEGPILESLVRRLAETPEDFLAEPRIAETGRTHVAAVVADLLRLLHAAPEGAQLTQFAGSDVRRDRNRLAITLLLCWLLSDNWFRQAKLEGRNILELLEREATELAPQVASRKFVTDPDRREELARVALARLGFRPAGETLAQAQDRLTTLNSAERARVMKAAQAGEQRARQIREALVRKAAEESADEYHARMSAETLTDAERYPTLTGAGRQMLEFLREHPHAPIFRNESGNRLTADDVTQVREFEREVQSAQIGWRPGELPVWLGDFVEHCLSNVPFYRCYGSAPADFHDLPTISRADLSRDVAQFVPDSAEIDRLINFRTSGTTGHSLLLASHPIVAANYLAFHKRALRRFGIELRHGRGQVGVVLVGFQRKCFTYVSVTPTMDESGLAKINLHLADWRDPNDRAKYLEALAPELYTADPIAFAELLTLPLQTKPRALLSTSMTLLPAMRQRLEERFSCPVLDLYSMNEAGPVGVANATAGGHVLLQHRLYVEIVDAAGHSMPPGERGEVVLTGGFNFCLPLLRYRTGDHAALRFNGTEPVLVGLEGRPPVRFRTMRSEWINNIEVTHALQRFAIPQFTLNQDSEGALHLRLTGGVHSEDQMRNALLEIFGPSQELRFDHIASFDGKVVQYTSDLTEGQA